MSDRRTFLNGAVTLTAAATLLPVFGCHRSDPGHGETVESMNLLSGCDDFDGRHYAACVSTRGDVRFMVPVPQRVHGSLLDKQGNSALFFARRPGNHLYRIDLNSGNLLQTVTTPSNRHFYGHGVLHPQTGLLYTTENDKDSLLGVIGVYQTQGGIQRVGEFPSYGIGPHQLALLSDQQTLVVANGGLATHPDSGRKTLNPDSMDSSLVYIDVQRGDLLEKHKAPDPKMSIRHLDVSSQDIVVVGVQHQGELTDQVPLLGSHQQGTAMQWWAMPESLQLRIQQYTASVAVDEAGKIAVISCPRGDLVTCWDIARGELIDTLQSEDAAGLFRAPSRKGAPEQWQVTNGTGEIYTLSLDNQRVLRSASHLLRYRWDNHITLI